MSKANTLTTASLMRAFGVSHMTISAWRQGSSREALPVVETGTRAVLFAPAKVKAWAKRNAVPIVDEKGLDPNEVKPVKPGPKVSALRVKQVTKAKPKLRASVRAKFVKATRVVEAMNGKA